MDRAYYLQTVDLVCFDLVDDGGIRLLVYLNIGSLFSCMHEHVLTKRKKIIKLGKSRGNYSVVY